MGAGAAEPSADGPWHGQSASFPASRDRYTGLTGPAMKGRRQGTTGRPIRAGRPGYVAVRTRSEPTPPWTSMSTRFVAVP